MNSDNDVAYDVSARKFHQVAIIVMLAAGFVLGNGAGAWLAALAGVIMLVGRYWWPADVFRQLVWRVLEPAGLIRRREVVEDHETRRVARVLGGLVFLAAAVLLALGFTWAWIFVAAIAVMIFLDAVFSFCALCALTYQTRRLAHRQG
jgi:hypothetical protein